MDSALRCMCAGGSFDLVAGQAEILQLTVTQQR